MMRRAWLVILAMLAFGLPQRAHAQSRGGGGGTTPQLDLSISPASITFASADPDVNPSIAAAPVIISVRVRQNLGNWTLTVLAGGDLIAGPATVDITNVSWTATPAPPYQSGTLSKTIAQRVASGTGNVNPAANGSVTFRLANSWLYSAGNYTQTLVFTLSAP
jgi:hypothetical protein